MTSRSQKRCSRGSATLIAASGIHCVSSWGICRISITFPKRPFQAPMQRIFETLCRLLAPITVFTAEEAWSYLGASKSVHLQLFPEPDPAFQDSAVEEQVTQLLSLRGVIGQAVERARQEKLI